MIVLKQVIFTIIVFSSIISAPAKSQVVSPSVAEDYRQRLQSYIAVIKGSENPEAIEDHIKFRAYLLSHEGRMKKPKLNFIDSSKLNEHSQKIEGVKARLGELSKQDSMNICSDINNQHLDEIDPFLLASRLVEAEIQSADRWMKHREEVLASLSPDGKETLNMFIDSDVVPGLTVAKQDTLGMFNEMPQMMLQAVYFACNQGPTSDKRKNSIFGNFGLSTNQ